MVLHSSDSMGIPLYFGTSWPANKLVILCVCGTQRECASSPDLGRRFIAILLPACGLWEKSSNLSVSSLLHFAGAIQEKHSVHSALTVPKYEKICSEGSRSSRSCSSARDTQLHVRGGHRVIWALESLSTNYLTSISSHPAVKSGRVVPQALPGGTWPSSVSCPKSASLFP